MGHRQSQQDVFDQDCTSELKELDDYFKKLQQPADFRAYMIKCVKESYSQDYTAQNCNQAMLSAQVVCLNNKPQEGEDFLYGL